MMFWQGFRRGFIAAHMLVGLVGGLVLLVYLALR